MILTIFFIVSFIGGISWGIYRFVKSQPDSDQFQEVEVCRECHGHAEEKFSGDEGWTVCDDCGMVEGGYTTMYFCTKCEENKHEPKCDCQ